MSPGEKPHSAAVASGKSGRRWATELREIVWLASTIGALSAAGVGLAVLLAGV